MVFPNGGFLKVDFKISGFNGKNIYDPIISLSFNIKITAKSLSLDVEHEIFSSWHLDKNIKNKEGDEDNEANFFHPEYHFHFGGHTMTKEMESNFGSLFLLESPRLAHLPLDGVLAIDFIIRNFYEKEKHKKLTAKPDYIKILRKAQERFWKPYILGLASHWNNTIKIEENLDPTELIPNLV